MSDQPHESPAGASDPPEPITDAALADAGLADPAFAEAALADPQTTFAAAEPLKVLPVADAPSQCLRCGADVSRLPQSARYCPRCGLDCLGPRPVPSVATHPAVPVPQLLGEWTPVSQLIDTPPALFAASLPAPNATSVMVEGYGKALFRLGQRYESGSATTANVREALRCYSKSARLGNAWALARIASHLMASEATPSAAPDAAPSAPDTPAT